MSSDTLYVGLMSGTSVDAIDSALVRANASGVDLLHTREHAIPAATRQRIAAISHTGPDEIERMGVLDRELGPVVWGGHIGAVGSDQYAPGRCDSDRQSRTNYPPPARHQAPPMPPPVLPCKSATPIPSPSAPALPQLPTSGAGTSPQVARAHRWPPPFTPPLSRKRM